MNLPRRCPPNGARRHTIGERVRAWWLAKALGTVLGMAIFFLIYFWLLRHPIFPVTVMPLTAVDRWIGFFPEALPLYLSLWIYVSLGPALLIERRELVSYGIAALALSAIGLGVFLVLPTAVPQLDVDWSQHAAFGFLRSIDASGNACPSLHVAFALFTAIGLERLLRQMEAKRVVRAFNWLWCAGISYSTIAVHQHVAIDVVAGAALGASVALLHVRLLRAFPGRAPVYPRAATSN
jgi:membrane-associated phospholipid phosphatase